MGIQSSRRSGRKASLQPDRGDYRRAPFVQLFDLEADVRETTNLAAKRPEIAAKISAILDEQIANGRSTPGEKLKNDVAEVRVHEGTQKRRQIRAGTIALRSRIGSHERFEGDSMCRNIKKLRYPDWVPTDEELHLAALQFVRKVSGYRVPSHANEQAFEATVEKVAAATRELFDHLEARGIGVARGRAAAGALNARCRGDVARNGDTACKNACATPGRRAGGKSD